MDLQPYLADLVRRSLFPVREITVKIAAIEYRSRFQLRPEAGDYIGIELGADVSTDVNLDDFMVFDNDELRAREFFKKAEPFASPGAYINFLTQEEGDRVAFAYGPAFARLVEIKKKYDPTNFFRMNQNIKPQ